MRVSYCCISCYLHFNIPLNMYTSNKMEYFGYIGGYSMREHVCIEVFKRRAGLSYRQMVSGYLLFITVYNNYTTKKLKNKAILNLKQYCMRCYVALSYVF